MLPHQHISILLAFLSVSCTFGQDCKDVELTEDGGVVTSPNYPNEYPHSANCNWTISAPEGLLVRLSFIEFDVEDPFFSCAEDFVTVWLGEKKPKVFCNGITPPEYLVSTSNVLKMQLKSDQFFTNGKGFEAKYEFITKDGVPVAGEKTDDDVDDWDETYPVTTTTSTTMSTTTTARATTTSTVSTTTIVSTTSLLGKITESTARGKIGADITDAPRGGDGISNNPGAMSGAVLGGIIGIAFIVFVILLIVAFVHWKRHKNKRIDLSTVETHDGKTLITKTYKKQNNKIVRIPEAETFPL